MPRVDFDKCTFCGECSNACQYHAIAVLGKSVTVFPSLCHGCGGCSDVCPEDAIEEISRPIGRLTYGSGFGVRTLEGRLNVGEALAPPVTRALRKVDIEADITVIDAPPGTSCPVIEAINDTDYVVLVTEPTPFGLNDLELAVGMVRELGLPFGVVVNRSDIGDGRVDRYCKQSGIAILMQIPFDRQIAEAYSRGEMLIDSDSGYRDRMIELYNRVRNRVKR